MRKKHLKRSLEKLPKLFNAPHKIGKTIEQLKFLILNELNYISLINYNIRLIK